MNALAISFEVDIVFSAAVQSYRVLWTGLGSQLARDVPFSAICWSTLEPVCVNSYFVRFWSVHEFHLIQALFSQVYLQVRRRLLSQMGDEANAAGVLGANFSAGFVAGSIAAAATCPLDVAKTRRQIEVFIFHPNPHLWNILIFRFICPLGSSFTSIN